MIQRWHWRVALTCVPLLAFAYAWRSWHEGGWWFPLIGALHLACACILTVGYRRFRAWERRHG